MAKKNKEKNITGKTEDLPLLRTGGLIITVSIKNKSRAVAGKPREAV